MSEGVTVAWRIDPSEPDAPTARQAALYDRLGCRGQEARAVPGFAAYAWIVHGWALTYPESTPPDSLADLLAAAQPSGLPEIPLPTYGSANGLPVRRRPDAARAPSLGALPNPIGRAAG